MQLAAERVGHSTQCCWRMSLLSSRCNQRLLTRVPLCPARRCQADAAGILESTAADFGLADRQRSVEPVRTQDWEQSIKASPLHRLRAYTAVVVVCYTGPGRQGCPPLHNGWEPTAEAPGGGATLFSCCGRPLPSLPLQDSYQPSQVAGGLWIVPVWSEPPEPAATNILLEPGGNWC